MPGAAKAAHSLASGARRLSKRLIASYVIDWILILGTAAVGGGLNMIQGARHAFSLQDPTISFPYRADTVSVGVLLIVAVVAPGIITAIISLLFIPGATAHKATPKALIWRRKFWEWNTAWMGLGVALAGAFMITEGLKDIAGKPRPHLLALCDPDLSPESIARWRVGGLGTSIDSAVPIVVDWHICRTTDTGALHNAFASWPSGHSSFSWAGMLYLTLFICAKFAVQIPYISPATSSSRNYISTFDEEVPHDGKTVPPRNEAAAPPIYLLIIAFIPIGVAFFISISRWFDYRHHGFDILSGSLIGIFTAWFGFRWYHLPVRTGSGWSWGARSRDRAFWLGVGIPTYVGDEGWESKNKGATNQNRVGTGGMNQADDGRTGDLESGKMVTRGGIQDMPEQTVANNGDFTNNRDFTDNRDYNNDRDFNNNRDYNNNRDFNNNNDQQRYRVDGANPSRNSHSNLIHKNEGSDSSTSEHFTSTHYTRS